MIPRDCKRLAEVDFPIAVVSKHAAREKSIRHGHPSTLHLWWARRPLASSRAMLLALLLPDPCDPHCPDKFKRQATEILRALRQAPANDADLRRGLLWFIGEFANWDMAAQSTWLQVGRDLVRAAHGDEAPLVVDPFAGGGSIPLEALRLGCEAFASDLNPVACLILKVMLEDIPRHGPGLADELRRAGKEIKEAAEKDLSSLYPPDPDGATPIAYLWARAVRCEAPNCGAEIPLMRSFWLCKKAKRKRALRPRVVRTEAASPRVQFEIFEPGADDDVRTGTVARAKATCVCCGSVLPPERVRAQLAAQRGGADVVFDERGKRSGGAFLLTVVTLKPSERGRHYRLPTDWDYEAVRRAQQRVARMLAEWESGGRQGLCPVPDEPLPPIGTLGFRVQRYGMLRWGDLFTARQKAALMHIGRAASRQSAADPVKAALGLVLGRCADYGSSGVVWAEAGEFVAHTFGRQALPIVWDFAEPVPWTNSSGNLRGAIEWVAAVIENIPPSTVGLTQQASAIEHPLPDQGAEVWFTDPPYYDAIPYSDLADYFLVWLKRALPDHSVLSSVRHNNSLSPKADEAVQDETKVVDGRPKDRAWFEETMARAFAEGRRVLQDDGVGSVVFAHKTTEGWEALLSGMIRGGWTITGSWPIATERPGRLRSQNSAALATSIHLVCRPRPEDAPVGDWANVLRELPNRVAEWMERLQGEGIRGADLVFACIGPALEVFSRHSRVETAEGHEVGLPAYLEKVWEVVGRTALVNVLGAAEAKARNGLAGALEEDARLTALFLWTLQATAAGDQQDARNNEEAPADEPETTRSNRRKDQGYSLAFDVVRRFAQPLGIDLSKWEKRTIKTTKGMVRLLPVNERAKQLFGERRSQVVAAWLEGRAATGTVLQQGVLFADSEAHGGSEIRERPPATAATTVDRTAASAGSSGMTTLDRVHTGMLLQAGGRTNALRALVRAERERGPDFLRLSNALSALYPRGSEEKRLLDGMLLAAPK